MPRLLRSLQGCPSIREVIVADNRSTDATRSIAHNFGCCVVQGGSPAEGRNAGAGIASGDILIFIDADVVVPAWAFRLVEEHFQAEATVAVHFRIAPSGGTRFVRNCYRIMDSYLRMLQQLGKAQGVGTFIAVRRDAFTETGGFDEHVKVGEDADFMRRVARCGTVVYDRRCVIYASPRRFEIENPYLFAAKTVFWAALRLAGHRSSVIPYRWLGYPQAIARREASWLAGVSVGRDTGDS